MQVRVCPTILENFFGFSGVIFPLVKHSEVMKQPLAQKHIKIIKGRQYIDRKWGAALLGLNYLSANLAGRVVTINDIRPYPRNIELAELTGPTPYPTIFSIKKTILRLPLTESKNKPKIHWAE